MSASAQPAFRLVEYRTRAEWLEARRLSIGSSDAAGLMGESNWSSPVQLNYQKRGLIPAVDPDPEREEALDWHREREAEIAKWWWSRQIFGAKGQASDEWEEFVSRPRAEKALALQEAGGVEMYDPGDFTVASREVGGIPLAATLDRSLVAYRLIGDTDLWMVNPLPGERARQLMAAAGGCVAPVELKNAAEWMRRHWTTSEPPLVYQIQLQHQLLVTGCSYGYLVASIGGQPPVWAEIKADPAMHRILLAAYRRFWQSVVENRDLPADYSDVTSKAIAARYPKDNGGTALLSNDADGWWQVKQRTSAEIKKLDEARDQATNALKQAIGEATYGILPSGTRLKLATDKNGKRTTLREEKQEANL